MCPSARRGEACPAGDACTQAHNVFELVSEWRVDRLGSAGWRLLVVGGRVAVTGGV